MSFFNKPEWAVKNDITEPQFYRRSKHTYSDIIAADRQAQSERKIKILAECSESTQDRKRPRIVEAEEANFESPITSLNKPEDEIQTENEGDAGSPPVPRQSHGRITETNTSLAPIKNSVNHLNEISSDHSRLHDLSACDLPQTLQKSPRKSESTSRSSISDQPIKSTSTQRITQVTKIDGPVVDDPVVQILITSVIPNTKPLVIQRKMSQALREVRHEWCKRQNFTQEEQSRVYFTWKSRRLFDVTTCRGLGIKSERKTSHSIIDDLDTCTKEVRIHLEAVTDDPMLREQAISPSREKSQQTLPPSSGDRQEEQAKLKLILRSPGMTDMTIRARPKAQVSQIIAAFRQKKKTPLDQEVSILFDGERLDPNMKLSDYDLDDEDLLDIQIKM